MARLTRPLPTLSALALMATIATAPVTLMAGPPDSQADLKPVLNSGGKEMVFDWPMISVGTGEYSEGPTGVTVFKFGRKVLGAVDVRGGGPGTVNTEFLDLHYPVPEVDAVVFSGGSWYGLESVTAVGTALKDDGTRTGNWDSVALSVGSIIYDYGERRLNEIYPDKKLAQAAYKAVQTGVFRNGAAGAGRMARSGDFFGCKSHSGQGGAFRQEGDLKIAAFTVVNAYGVVTGRDGAIVACNRDPNWPEDVTVHDLMRNLPESKQADWKGPRGNTTVSLIVVNQAMDPSELQRLAVQVHTSMARGLQPYATMGDGDVLYAISTAELEAPELGKGLSNPEIGAIASEVMWDAILNSVPEQPTLQDTGVQVPVAEKILRSYAGNYRFSSFVSVGITAENGRLYAQATGERNAFVIGKNVKTELHSIGDGRFAVPGRYPLVLSFETPKQLIINPGLWQQTGKRE